MSCLKVGEKGLGVQSKAGELFEARDVVLALALEQARALLETLPQTPPVRGIKALLAMFATVPSLTLVAGYGLESPAPSWELQYPEDSSCLQLISHDSSKREDPRVRVLVLQARPAWSRARLDLPPETWAGELLHEAEHRLGAWVGQPRFTYPHRWRYARLERSNELVQPVCIALDGGLRVGLAGELFSRGGGVEAAWLSGRRLARRLIDSSWPLGQENPRVDRPA